MRHRPRDHPSPWWPRGQGAPADRPGRGRAPLRPGARQLVPDFIALRGDPQTACRARRASAKRAADILRRHGSLEAALEQAEREGLEVNSLARQAEELRAFREIATLQPVKVKRPRDKKTRSKEGRRGRARAGDEGAGEAVGGVRRAASGAYCGWYSGPFTSPDGLLSPPPSRLQRRHRRALQTRPPSGAKREPWHGTVPRAPPRRSSRRCSRGGYSARTPRAGGLRRRG